ncbi:hypothetical protein ONZ51_g9479 [Trametes cubensis]|uniref:F-box domain-containing protein n=1 Tax=Trametes cubensis TaxID=1111947 RepID=A0AAD7X9S1_9APHY|nr:hypothetical protein ONZ51_g9479 [Trametes cubensis]
MHHTSKPLAAVLPAEIKHEIFSYLAEDRISLCRFAHVHRSWTDSAQYELFKNARITSAHGLQSALGILASEHSSHLRYAVAEWTLRGKIPGSTARSWLSSEDAPGEWLPAPNLAPRLHSVRFQHWDPPRIKPSFFDRLFKLTSLTELHLHDCSFKSTQTLSDLFFYIPHLGSLTLFGVRWDGPRGEFTSSDWTADRPLNLHTLRIRTPRADYGPFFRWLVQHKCVGVRHLEVTMFDHQNARQAGWYVEKLGPGLEELVFGLCLPATGEPWAYDQMNLQNNRNLRSLSFDIHDAQPFFSHWIYKVLGSAAKSPLRTIAFSLSLLSRDVLFSTPWEVIHDALMTDWKGTLRQVAVTHHADWRFMEDAKPAFFERFPELARRGMLSVYNVETEDSAATRRRPNAEYF